VYQLLVFFFARNDFSIYRLLHGFKIKSHF